MILSYTWLKNHNLEVNWQTGEVQINRCSPQCEGCRVMQKEQALWKRMETRDLNVCRSRPSLGYAEDSEEDEASVRTWEAEYEPGDRLFMTRILPNSIVEDLCATSMTSQKLAEGTCRSTEAWKEPFIPPDYVRGFESVFAKKDFDVLLEHRQ